MKMSLFLVGEECRVRRGLMQDRVGHRKQCGICLIERDARLHSAENRKPPCMYTRVDMISRCIDDGISRKRRENLGALRRVSSYKALRHHSNNGKRHIGDNQLAPYDIGITVEPLLPESLTEDDSKPCWT